MSDGSVDDTEWEFQKGETLVEQRDEPRTPDIGDFGGIDDPTEYTVKRRLYDADEGKRLYYLEWKRETAGGPSVENQLYDAGLVRLHYRSVDTGTERFVFDQRLRRWGSVRDALGLNPVAEQVEGLELVSEDEHEIRGINSATLSFESVSAVETAIQRLKDMEQETKDSGCYDEAEDVLDYRIALSEWLRYECSLRTATDHPGGEDSGEM